jgi:hypothetical protein
MFLLLANALNTGAIRAKPRKLVEETYNPRILVNKLVEESLAETPPDAKLQDEDFLSVLKNILDNNFTYPEDTDFFKEMYNKILISKFEEDFITEHGFSPWESYDKFIEAEFGEGESDSQPIQFANKKFNDVTVTDVEEQPQWPGWFPGKDELPYYKNFQGKMVQEPIMDNPSYTDWKDKYGGRTKPKSKRYKRRVTTHRKKKTIKRRKTRRTKRRR